MGASASVGGVMRIITLSGINEMVEIERPEG